MPAYASAPAGASAHDAPAKRPRRNRRGARAPAGFACMARWARYTSSSAAMVSRSFSFASGGSVSDEYDFPRAGAGAPLSDA